MFWRYLFFSFLLGVPSSRIFTSGSVSSENTQELRNEEALIRNIIQHLNPERSRDQSINLAAKKDDAGQAVVEKPSATDSEINVAKVDKSIASEDSQTDIPQGVHGVALAHEAGRHSQPLVEEDDRTFLVTVSAVAGVCLVGLLMAGVCYYKLRKSSKAASDVEYPAYGVTGPMKERVPSPGDRKLAQSAQMYHYQHQKQQMIAMEKANGDMKHDASDDDSEEDNVEGDYTVYECPGLAPTGEMEVKNPLFRGDETPVTPNQEHVGESSSQPGSPSGAEH